MYNALTGQAIPTGVGGHGKVEIHLATAAVPDARVDALVAMYRPRKTVYATVTFVDVDYPAPDEAASLPGPVRNELARAEGLIHVVRAFAAADVPHPLGSVDPVRDIRTMRSEMLLSDLLTVEARLDKLRSEWPKRKGDERKVNEEEQELLDRFHVHLSAERPLRELGDAESSEFVLVRGFGLFTLRPELVVVNTDEGGTLPVGVDAEAGSAIAFPGALEAEIAQLAPDDRDAFLAEFGIAEPVSRRAVRLAYDLVGIHSFFTVGEDEVRAWPLPVGATAVDAAGTIHTDLARGFIRAETTAYDELMSYGDMHKVKAAGRQRLEGKTYVVRDGDILTIRSGT